MKRRNFLIGGIVASAAVRAWPFRVYSFPSQIINFDFAAEKEKYIRLARAYIEEQIVKYGRVAPFFCCGGAGAGLTRRQSLTREGEEGRVTMTRREVQFLWAGLLTGFVFGLIAAVIGLLHVFGGSHSL